MLVLQNLGIAGASIRVELADDEDEILDGHHVRPVDRRNLGGGDLLGLIRVGVDLQEEGLTLAVGV